MHAPPRNQTLRVIAAPPVGMKNPTEQPARCGPSGPRFRTIPRTVQSPSRWSPAGPNDASLTDASGDTRDRSLPWGPAEQVDAARQLVGSPDTAVDLLVVGAGITGAGIARDAALRGLKVGVVEASDVAYGTSSRSTRLIHGGVRYLEQGEVGLVFEALRERSRFYDLAPHLARRARFLFPTYRGDRLGTWRLRLGLTVYDALDFHRGEGHTYVPPDACMTTEPLLRRDGLQGAVAYEDAVTDDARLTLAVLQDARRHGAIVLTYTKVVDIQRADAHGDVATPDRGSADTLFRVTLQGDRYAYARQVVVATGPWTDGTLMKRQGERLLTRSKGIHLVLRSRDVPVRQPVVVQAPGQRRILFVIPWGTRTYLGTTDQAYEGDPGHSGVTEADERELLSVVGRLLPGANLDPANIVSAWSGVRPLVRDTDGGGTEELSRRHRVVERDDGVLALVGGKLTTYRAMAQEVVDTVVARLGTQVTAARCTTHQRPLVAGPALTGRELCDPELADLAPRHGPDARHLLSGTARLVEDLPYRWSEVDQAIAFEGCRHIDDILRRRLPLALTDPALGGGVARAVAQRLVDAWGGNEADVKLELERYRDAVVRETRRSPTDG